MLNKNCRKFKTVANNANKACFLIRNILCQLTQTHYMISGNWLKVGLYEILHIIILQHIL